MRSTDCGLRPRLWGTKTRRARHPSSRTASPGTGKDLASEGPKRLLLPQVQVSTDEPCGEEEGFPFGEEGGCGGPEASGRSDPIARSELPTVGGARRRAPAVCLRALLGASRPGPGGVIVVAKAPFPGVWLVLRTCLPVGKDGKDPHLPQRLLWGSRGAPGPQ